MALNLFPLPSPFPPPRSTETTNWDPTPVAVRPPRRIVVFILAARLAKPGMTQLDPPDIRDASLYFHKT
jgi:hypothetical protein